ncbi:hypothetical protein [Streptomyces qinglanensis]|uniref:hypothetical protein n=1 Tax=Streptomyces qinglanensis TaxID=943816 RepID=UPI00379B29FA
MALPPPAEPPSVPSRSTPSQTVPSRTATQTVPSPDAAAWERALGTLGPWLAAVGPRRHADWLQDVSAVLRLGTRDPRGWHTVDQHAGSSSRTSQAPYYPLALVDAHYLDHHLELITRRVATMLLTRHCAEYGGPPFHHHSAAALHAAARTVLARFGPAAEFATNEDLLTDEFGDDTFDDEEGGAQAADRCRRSFAVNGLTHPAAERDGYLMDMGVVAASETEVGVFWNYFID